MLSKHAIILDSNNIVGVIWIIFLQMKQDLKLDSSLMLEFLLVSDDLNGNDLPCLMVNALECLSKGSFSQKVNHLESICDLVLYNHIVVSSLIIVSEIVLKLF